MSLKSNFKLQKVVFLSVHLESDEITNHEIIQRVKESGISLKKNMMKRKIQYFGHIKRNDRIQKTLIEAKVKERRQRGRPHGTWVTDIREWTEANIGKCVRSHTHCFFSYQQGFF